jgi:hypothetical protein
MLLILKSRRLKIKGLLWVWGQFGIQSKLHSDHFCIRVKPYVRKKRKKKNRYFESKWKHCFPKAACLRITTSQATVCPAVFFLGDIVSWCPWWNTICFVAICDFQLLILLILLPECYHNRLIQQVRLKFNFWGSIMMIPQMYGGLWIRQTFSATLYRSHQITIHMFLWPFTMICFSISSPIYELLLHSNIRLNILE